MTTSPASMPAGAGECSGAVVRPRSNQEKCRRKRPGGWTIYGRRRRKAPPSAPALRPARRVPASPAALLRVPTATWRATAGGPRRGAPSRIRESRARPGHPLRQGSPVGWASRLGPLPFRNPHTTKNGPIHSQVHRSGPRTPRAQRVAARPQAGLPVRGRPAVVRPVSTRMTQGLVVHAKPAGRHVELRHPGVRPTAASEIKSGPGRAVWGSTRAAGRPRVHGTRHLTKPAGTTPFRSPGPRSSPTEGRGRAGAPSILAG
jgi:hypothetical protein